MFHLDYLSCFLTVLATILLARKSWIGLLIAIVNSLIVCAIALRTSQLGFIPANLFCICIYASSMRSWLKEQTHTNRDPAQPQDSGSIADGPRMCPAMQHRIAAGTPQKAPRSSFVHIHLQQHAQSRSSSDSAWSATPELPDGVIYLDEDLCRRLSSHR
jgi:hypothetical protein